MAANLLNGYVSAGGDPNVMQLPEHVDGFIDVEILVDIHECLSESKFDDDRALGVWVKANYLQEPLQTAHPIRDAEGFVNLDKAYRRARQLTGKAQDKWPFLNKDWKKMSSIVIKNAILGDAAMGTVRSETSGGVRDTPMSNGLGGQHDKALQSPKLHASLSANNLSRHKMQELKSPQPTDHLLNQQGTEQKAHRQDHSPVSKPSSMSGISGLDSSANGTPPSAEALRDAGAGKVRGPNGRYVNKDNPTPPAKKKPNIKYVKKSRTRAALEGESEEVDGSSDEEVEEPRRPSQTISMSPNSEGEKPQDSSEPPVNAQSAAAKPNEFPVSAILAAEAEAVPSNLDRLPPGFTHKKRKSESSIPRGGFKRSRGSRGGVLGRPRKSETLAERSKLEPEETMEVEQSTPQPKPQPTPQPETPASAPTRRSSRKSAVSALESSTPWDPADDVLFSGASQKQPARDSTATPMNGTNKAFNRSSLDQKPMSAAKEAVNGTPSTAPAKSSATQVKAQKTPNSTKHKKRVSFSPETQAEVQSVKFFARITTGAGTQEVPLLREDLTHEVDLVEHFAAWQTAGNAPVSFEVFKNIVKFVR